MRTDEEQAKGHLSAAKEHLTTAWLIIDRLNKSGNQFDYVTDSDLSTKSDNVMRLAKMIENAIYQEEAAK